MAPDIMIPIAIDADNPSVAQVVKDILEQHEKYGFDMFLLACPYGSWRSAGYPPEEVWDAFAEKFIQIRDAVRQHGVRCGWWLEITVKSGLLEGATPMLRADGTPSAVANCPLDPVFRDRLAADVARFAARAKPDCIITEDDFSINAATDKLGCFCAHHIAAFNRRQGASYTRETLAEALTAGTPEAETLDRAWRTLKKDSLVLLAQALRDALDVQTPEIPLGYMQSGSSYKEDNAAYAIAKAMAGPRHRPFARIFGTFYSGATAREIPRRLYRCLWIRQHITEEFTFLHEADTYPHTRFFSSSAAMNTLMACAYAMGFSGSTFQTQQLLDDANEESDVYGNMFRRERRRFETVCTIAAQCRVCGVQLCYDPYYDHPAPSWCSAVSRMGIPYTTTASQVAFWDETQALHAPDAEVLAALSGGLVLDGAAAKALCARGYGSYLGVSVGDDAAAGMLRYDLGAREVICEPFRQDGAGSNMPAAQMFAPGGNGIPLRLTVTDERCETITELRTFRDEVVCPAMTRFCNRLGGRVVVMGETVEKNRSQSLLNYRRQRLLQEMVLWCGGDLAMALKVPDIFVIENHPVSPDADFYAMLTLSNLCEDTPEPFELYLPPAWRESRVCVMDANGGWRDADCEKTERGILLREPAAYYHPVYLLFKK